MPILQFIEINSLNLSPEVNYVQVKALMETLKIHWGCCWEERGGGSANSLVLEIFKVRRRTLGFVQLQ